MRNKYVFILTVPFFFFGCVVNATLSKEDSQKIRSIAISEKVETPPVMTYSPPRNKKTAPTSVIIGGILGGAVGGAVAAALTTPSEVVPEDIPVPATTLVNDNNISIEKIIKEEMAFAIIKAEKFPYKANADKSSSTLSIVINDYGLTSDPFSDSLKPVLRLTCSLVDSTGKDVWYMSDQLSKNTEIAPISLNDMNKDPTLIDGLWRKAAREVVTKMVHELTK